jgi:hypothetical protein
MTKRFFLPTNRMFILELPSYKYVEIWFPLKAKKYFTLIPYHHARMGEFFMYRKCPQPVSSNTFVLAYVYISREFTLQRIDA